LPCQFWQSKASEVLRRGIGYRFEHFDAAIVFLVCLSVRSTTLGALGSGKAWMGERFALRLIELDLLSVSHLPPAFGDKK